MSAQSTNVFYFIFIIKLFITRWLLDAMHKRTNLNIANFASLLNL